MPSVGHGREETAIVVEKPIGPRCSDSSNFRRLQSEARIAHAGLFPQGTSVRHALMLCSGREQYFLNSVTIFKNVDGVK